MLQSFVDWLPRLHNTLFYFGINLQYDVPILEAFCVSQGITKERMDELKEFIKVVDGICRVKRVPPGN